MGYLGAIKQSVEYALVDHFFFFGTLSALIRFIDALAPWYICGCHLVFPVGVLVLEIKRVTLQHGLVCRKNGIIISRWIRDCLGDMLFYFGLSLLGSYLFKKATLF